MGAAVHFGVATYNAAVQEYNVHPEEASDVFDWDWGLKDGFLVPGDRPGIGVDIDEKAAARFEYERAYLPISRREDGSVGNY
jgi:mannonate dehydratase